MMLTKFTHKLLKSNEYALVPLAELSKATGVPRSTLRRAAGDKRLEARKIGNVWHASQVAVEEARQRKDMRRVADDPL